MRGGVACLLMLLAAGCSGGREDPAPAPTPSATVAAPRTLVPADFDPAKLGAKIEGPKGAEPEFPIMAGGKEVGRIISYVACPVDMPDGCDPATLPAGTVLTYVHILTPAAEAPAATPSPSPTGSANAAVARELPPALFRMTRAAPGFSGAVGFSREQALAALGGEDALSVTIDEGQLIWRVTAGSGWKPGLPVTVWWQTTAAPQGPVEAYSLDLNGLAAKVTAPFPAPEKPVEGTAKR